MKVFRVRYAVAARDDLMAILDYVAERASVEAAEGFVSRLMQACDDLELVPLRGTARDDLSPGLRTVGVERRATILFRTLETEGGGRHPWRLVRRPRPGGDRAAAQPAEVTCLTEPAA